MDKIRLANGNEYDIENNATQYYLSMIVDTLGESVPVVEEFTEENLKIVEFLSGEEVEAVYYDKKVINTVNTRMEDGRYNVVFHLGDVDMMAKRLAALEANQMVLEEALIEVAALV